MAGPLEPTLNGRAHALATNATAVNDEIATGDLWMAQGHLTLVLQQALEVRDLLNAELAREGA